MEAIRSSKTSVYPSSTQSHIPEDNILQIHGTLKTTAASLILERSWKVLELYSYFLLSTTDPLRRIEVGVLLIISFKKIKLY
jgi:hypothetical protein